MRNATSVTLLLLTIASAPRPAAAICRIVEEPDSPPPSVDPKQSVLFVQHHDIELGDGCADGDAGQSDGGTADAGSPDGGAFDASTDGGASCEIVGDAITMTVQPRLSIASGGSNFALLMVTPAPPVVDLEPIDLFSRLAAATQPAISTNEIRVEDASLGYQCHDPYVGGCGGSNYQPPGNGDFPTPPTPDWDDPESQVLETIGPYEIARINATSAAELESWLTSLGYIYSQDDIDAVAPYIELGFTVTAVRVRTDVQFLGGLQPLSFTYPGTEMRMPIGVSRQTAPAETRIATYVIADGRYEFPGSTLFFADAHPDRPGEFITRATLVRSLASGPEDDPVAEHIAGDAPYRETVVVDQTVRVPLSDCPDPPNEEISLCACTADGAPGRGAWALFLCTLLGLAFTWRRAR